jgi:3-isopropylmalate dehydrogenase
MAALTIPTSRMVDGNPFLSSSLPDWDCRDDTAAPVVGVLTGEGIGAEVVGAACDVLDRVRASTQRPMDISFGGKIGRPAQAECGAALSDEVIDFCESVFARRAAPFCADRAAAASSMTLRAHFALYCKLTPVRHLAAIDDASILRPERLDGVDLIVVRENAGGLYFGRSESAGRGPRRHPALRLHRQPGAADSAPGNRSGPPAPRSARAGAEAGRHSGHQHTVAENLEQLAAGTGVTWQVLEVDNAAYQLIANPRELDVMVAPNMFGDVLSDAASLLLGSRGMSFSGNFGAGRRAVYQTGHGAAHDLAGRDCANPVGQIFSLAMMLRESFGWQREAAAIEAAIATVLGTGLAHAGHRFRNIPRRRYRELGERIAAAAADLL